MRKENSNFTDVSNVERLRNELRVQAHLFKSEIKKEWQGLEREWKRWERRGTPVKRAAKEAALDLKEASETLLRTLKQGYERIKRSLPT